VGKCKGFLSLPKGNGLPRRQSRLAMTEQKRTCSVTGEGMK